MLPEKDSRPSESSRDIQSGVREHVSNLIALWVDQYLGCCYH